MTCRMCRATNKQASLALPSTSKYTTSSAKSHVPFLCIILLLMPSPYPQRMTSVANGTIGLSSKCSHVTPLVNMKPLLKCSLLWGLFQISLTSPPTFPLLLTLPYIFPLALTTFWHIIQLTYYYEYHFFVCLPIKIKDPQRQDFLSVLLSGVSLALITVGPK